MGPVTQLASAAAGLALFGTSFATFRLTDNPPSGLWALALELAGWLGLLVAARLVTRGWLAPALVAAAAVLLLMGAGFATHLIRRGTDRGLQLGFNYAMTLITLEAGAWLLAAILMLRGAARLWREDTERESTPR